MSRRKVQINQVDNPKSAIRNPQSAIGSRKVAAVVAAGGRGIRAGSAIPKQFLELAGKPILLHAIESVLLLPDLSQIVVTLPSKQVSSTRDLLRRQRWRVPIECVRGGKTRQESVHRGVTRVSPESDLILVHDAVRPFCDHQTMQRVVETAWEKGAAVPGLPSTETIQRVSSKGQVLRTPPRKQLFAIQTPQCFHSNILRASLEQASKAGFLGTDESSVVHWAGHRVTVVEGAPENIKITRPVDLEIAQRFLAGTAKQGKTNSGMGSNANIRVGQGVDYHRLVKGRKLVLGGVEIPFEKGLVGHSDADALSHAVSDALLGAAGLGDIGQHFSDQAPLHSNRSSLEFLREIHVLIQAKGWTVRNVDATVIAERPKLAPYREAMQRRIAETLSISSSRVNIKATTTEGMNSEGREEGISSQAVVLLDRT